MVTIETSRQSDYKQLAFQNVPWKKFGILKFSVLSCSLLQQAK